MIHTDLGTLREDGSIMPPKMKFKIINGKKALRLIKYNPKLSSKFLLSEDDPALGYLKRSRRVTWLNPLIEKELDKAIRIMSEIHSEFQKDKKDRINLQKYIIVLEEAISEDRKK